MGIEYFVGFVIGCVVQAIVFCIFKAVSSSFGVLKIDHSNPEKDVYRIVLGDLDNLKKKKYVELKIDHNADLSQE